ncbi:MAG: glycosyltransferase family 2 protein [Lachnospiraceae bacterium]
MVSIIVPVFKAKEYIKETIEMVCKQTYKEWELILVDDCSSDGTLEYIEEIIKEKKDTRIRLIKKEKNEGAAKARNTGLYEAKGDKIAYLDADDVWKEEKLEIQLAFMEEKECAFVFSSYEFGDEKAIGTGKIVTVPERITYNDALSRTVIFTSTVLIDRKKVSNEILEMPNVPSEDSATWWQILKTGIVGYGCKECLVIYRRPKNSLSSNKIIAIKRIWYLYRNVEQLSLIKSCYHLIRWAIKATLRRI